MATELTVQHEKAFQKQPHINLNTKVKAKTSRPGKNGRRWYKDVGLGFRTPKAAIEGHYIGVFDLGEGAERGGGMEEVGRGRRAWQNAVEPCATGGGRHGEYSKSVGPNTLQTRSARSPVLSRFAAASSPAPSRRPR
jgi:hypothetical protein